MIVSWSYFDSDDVYLLALMFAKATYMYVLLHLNPVLLRSHSTRSLYVRESNRFKEFFLHSDTYYFFPSTTGGYGRYR